MEPMDINEFRRQLDIIIDQHDAALRALREPGEMMDTVVDGVRTAEDGSRVAIDGLGTPFEGLRTAIDGLRGANRKHDAAIAAALEANQAALKLLRSLDERSEL
jgi:flagellar biosynthesis/type III secretory pathway chaperone